MTERSPLARLVDEVCEANGWSRREVARRARAAGGTISPSRLGQLLTEYPLGGIQADKIDDLATGLGISRDRVAVAVIQAMGFRVSDNTISPAEAIRRDATLPTATKEALLAILRTAPNRTGGGGHEDRPAAMTRATRRQPDYVTTDADGRALEVEAKTTPAAGGLRGQLQEMLAAATSDRERAQIQELMANLDRGEAGVADPSSVENAG